MKSRADQRRALRRRRLISLSLLVLIAAASPLWSGWIMDGFTKVMARRMSHCRLEHVDYSGLRYLTADSLEQAARFPYGESLFQIDYRELQRRMLALPWVKEASVLRRLPDQLEVRIVERVPVATVRSSQIFALTADAVVLPVPAAEWVWGLPLITPPEKLGLTPGKRIEEPNTIDLLQQVVGIREASPELLANVSELYFHGSEIRATLLSPPVVLRMNRANEHRTWIALQELLATEFSDTEYKEPVVTIDLRIPGNIVVNSPEIAQLVSEHTNL